MALVRVISVCVGILLAPGKPVIQEGGVRLGGSVSLVVLYTCLLVDLLQLLG